MISVNKLFYILLGLCLSVSNEQFIAGVHFLEIESSLCGIKSSQFLGPLLSVIALLPAVHTQSMWIRTLSALATTLHYLVSEGGPQATHERFSWLLLVWAFVFATDHSTLFESAKRYILISYTVSGIWKLSALIQRFQWSLPYGRVEKILPEQIAHHFLVGYPANTKLLPLLLQHPGLSASLWISLCCTACFWNHLFLADYSNGNYLFIL